MSIKFSNNTENAIKEAIATLEEDTSRNIIEINLTSKSKAFIVKEDSEEGQKRLLEKASIMNTFSDESYKTNYLLCRK
jgi:hypothetical protein